MTADTERSAVIIVGSTGLIGSSLVKRFAGTYRVFAMDIRPPEGDLPEDAEFIKVDVSSDEGVRAAMDKMREQHSGSIASVIQLAAYYDFSGEPSDMYEKITVNGSRRMAQAACDANAEQFVFSSTMLVHAPTRPGQPFDENQPLDAKWDYPRSKIEAEQAIREACDDMPVVLLRVAGVYSDYCDSLPLSHQIQRIRERRMTSMVYPGDTDCGQSFVHIDDLTDAFWKTVERRRELPREVLPILIGEPETPSYGQLQKAFARLLHKEPTWTTRQIPKTMAKSGAWVQDKVPGIEDPFIKPWMIDLADDHYELDISRARDLLKWKPQHRLMDTLDNMIKALRADPQGWYDAHDLETPESLGGGSRPESVT